MSVDLTKIDRPFGELDDETAAALFLADRRGGRIQILWSNGIWQDKHTADGLVRDSIYRLAPKPVRPDSIDWSHVAEGWNYMARDENGALYFYGGKPRHAGSAWAHDVWSVCAAFASYRRGTCDWRDSLVIRPGVECAK